MPVTAKLSQEFYRRLGDDIANELVEWFNSVDATYRADLREINDLNFARFDAKMEQRLAELGARIDALQIDQRFAAFEKRIDARFVAFEDKLGRRLAEFESRLMGRMFAFWTGQTVALAALIYAILHGK